LLSFDRPWWLLLLVPMVALVVIIGRKSLSGMAGWSRRFSLVVRIIVVTLIVCALADPKWRLTSKTVNVTAILDVSRSMPDKSQEKARQYLDLAGKDAERDDQLAIVSAGRDAIVVERAGRIKTLDIKSPGGQDATNLGDAVRLSMAVAPGDAANRMVLISDGNETVPGLIDAAKAAQAAKIPIDVLPVRYVRDKEVIVDKLIAPATARQGEVVQLRIALTSTHTTSGRLTLLLNGTPVKLDDSSSDGSAKVDLSPGLNIQSVPVALPGTGPMKFDVVFEPVTGGDTLLENNKASGVTFVGGEGRVLILANARQPQEADQLKRVLEQSSIKANFRSASEAWSSITELGSYEAVVLVNTPASDFSVAQQEELVAYVHELGGGLIMIGGDESFGAGGWIGSPLAEALPIKLDPPQKRQMPKGALVMAMHSCEVPEGNYWGRRCAEEAIKALSSRDMAGIIEYAIDGSNGWVFPIRELGDKSAALRAASAMSYGDMPDFESILSEALKGLNQVQAGQKHVILISDGDPSGPSDSLLQAYVSSKVSISTVAVFPHSFGGGELAKMRRVAKITGGNYYEITNSTGNLNEIPQIFVKEAQTVKRSLIWEGDPFSPAIVDGGSEPMRGITKLPAITGYVVAADRDGLAQVVLRGKENDPILSQWQHGLGRVIAFTGDATNRWSSSWVAWQQFKSFWEQHIRWAMRPAGSPNLRVVTEERGDKTQIIVEALDDQGERLNFLQWKAAAVDPERQRVDVNLRQVGPGRYEALIPTSKSGAYTVSMGYEQNDGTGQVRRGTVQAAITRPFPDEYRALKDNLPLLEQVAKLTGGRVLSEDPASAGLWSREGLTLPVSLVPVWLTVALTAVGMFLVDVAIRRVRIDVRAIASWVGSAFGKGKQQAAARTESLRQAREAARARMASEQRMTGPSVGTFESFGAGDANKGVKFEATAAELDAAKKAGDFAKVVFSEKPVEEPRDEQPGEPGEGALSRLKKARQRAQDEISDS
jgi:uncharacterized membrane protein